MALVEEGGDDKAAVEFRNALRLRRDFADANYNLGLLYERRGNMRAAAGSFRAAVESDPSIGEAQLKLGQTMMMAGDVDGARSHVEEAARLLPQNADARATRATLLLRDDDVEAAAAEIDVALEIDPDNTAAHTARISLLARAGDIDGALALVDERLAAQPGEIAYGLIKLQLLEQRGDTEAVGAHLETLADTFPEQLTFRRALVQWRIGRGDIEGAERELRILADSEGMEGVMRLVGFLSTTQSPDAGRRELLARIETETAPGVRAELRQSVAELDIQAGRVDEAKAALREIIADAATPTIANSAKVRLAHVEYAVGDREAATVLVQEVLAEDAENPAALAMRAAFAIDDLRPEDAVIDLRAALRGDPENARYMLLQATAHERQGDMSAAGERLAAAARASSFTPEVALRYASFLRERGELSAAEATLNESARRNPSSRDVMARLAEVRLLLQDYVGADQAAAALRGLSGGEAIADQISAAALTAQGRVEEGISLLERNAERDDAGAGALLRLVSAYVRAGEIERATALLDDILADGPDNAAALLLRAELHLLSGEVDAAIDMLARLRAATPNSVVGDLATARFEFARGDIDAADLAVEAGLAENPASADLLLLRAQIRERQADFDGAIEVYSTLYEKNRDSIVVANNLASLIAEHQSDDAEALAFAERVAQRLRGYDAPELKDTYGWILFLRGEMAAALPYLRDAAAALPENAIVRYHLGRAYAALGQTDLARENLEAALAAAPDFAKAASARDFLDDLKTEP